MAEISSAWFLSQEAASSLILFAYYRVFTFRLMPWLIVKLPRVTSYFTTWGGEGTAVTLLRGRAVGAACGLGALGIAREVISLRACGIWTALL